MIIFGGPEVEMMFPKLVEAPTALNASKGQDVLGAANGPAHAGLFATPPNDRLASRLNDS